MNELQSVLLDVDEAQAILRLAGESRRRMDLLSSDDLVRAANEMGVDAEHIYHAEQIVRERQSELDDRAEFRREKVKEVLKTWGPMIPIGAAILLGHAYGSIFQVLMYLKGGIKGAAGVFFAKSTSHELEFQEWRNNRWYIAEYGSADAGVILSHHLKAGQKATYGELYDWLVEENGVNRFGAVRAIETYAKRNPGLVEYKDVDRVNRDVKFYSREIQFNRRYFGK